MAIEWPMHGQATFCLEQAGNLAKLNKAKLAEESLRLAVCSARGFLSLWAEGGLLETSQGCRLQVAVCSASGFLSLWAEGESV